MPVNVRRTLIQLILNIKYKREGKKKNELSDV